jgi:hypothetical protein
MKLYSFKSTDKNFTANRPYKRKFNDEDWKKAREERSSCASLRSCDNHKIANSQSWDKVVPMTDDELEARINALKPKIKRNKILSGVFTVLGFIAIIYFVIRWGDLGFWLMSPVLGIGFAFGMKANQYRQRLKLTISDNVVRGVLTDKFEVRQYAPSCHLSQIKLKESGLIPSWNVIRGSDLVVGTYKGVSFSFSDIELIRESGSGKNRSRTTVFKGQWLIFDTVREVPLGVMLRERDRDNRKAKSDIETENIEFNRRFVITCHDPHTAFFILTPHFMEYIIKADNRAQARTFINISGRSVHVALHNGRDLFEPDGKKIFTVNSIATLRMQMRWDVNYIAGIIDEFLLNETLFGKET